MNNPDYIGDCDTCCNLEVEQAWAERSGLRSTATHLAHELYTHQIRAHRNPYTLIVVQIYALSEKASDRRVTFSHSAMLRKTAKVWTI